MIYAGLENNDFETGLNNFNYGVEARDAAGNWSAAENISLNVTDVDEIAPTVSASRNLPFICQVESWVAMMTPTSMPTIPQKIEAIMNWRTDLSS